MNPHLKASITSLIAVFALLGIVVGLTRAHEVLTTLDALFLALACTFFIVSIVIWVISWAYLLKKRTSASYRHLLTVGVSSVYGALTPIQLGADALRSLRMKELFGVGYSDSLAASMIAKGTKFVILGIVAVAVFLLFFVDIGFNPALLLAFFSGLCVIFLAIFLFLSPLRSGFGHRIASFFERLPSFIPFTSRLGRFFKNYSSYLSKTTRKTFLSVFLLVALSWIFEFLALQFSFFSLGVSLPLHSLLIFMVLVSVLERTPLLPRGIGLVEFVGYHFLAFPELVAGTTMSISQIGGVLIAYDFARLVVPTVVSILVSAVFLRAVKKSA